MVLVEFILVDLLHLVRINGLVNPGGVIDWTLIEVRFLQRLLSDALLTHLRSDLDRVTVDHIDNTTAVSFNSYLHFFALRNVWQEKDCEKRGTKKGGISLNKSPKDQQT